VLVIFADVQKVRHPTHAAGRVPAYSSEVNLGVMCRYACIEELSSGLCSIHFFFLHVQARLFLSFNLISSVEQAHECKFFLHFDGGLSVVI
jgi:hypothetical protein